MDIESVKQLLMNSLEDCEVHVQSADGSHFDVLVIGDVFAGLRPVKKQQLVYAVLNEHILNGSMHAVNIKTFTPQEWAARNPAG